MTSERATTAGAVRLACSGRHKMRRRVGPASVVLALCVVSAACGARATRVGDDPTFKAVGLGVTDPTAVQVAAAQADDPATSVTPVTDDAASTSSTDAATTTTSVQLPVPEKVPSDPYAPTPDANIAMLDIPKLGIHEQLHEGVTLTAIDRGPSHWPGTALPGQIGNMVVAGHRVTHTHPFRHIDDLAPGDEAIFTVGGQRYVYVVTSHEVVDQRGIHIVDQSTARTATFFACHPPGSAQYRYVVHLALQDDPGVPAAATTTAAGQTA